MPQSGYESAPGANPDEQTRGIRPKNLAPSNAPVLATNPDVMDRLKTVEHASGGTLPTSLSYGIAQRPDPELALRRAAVLAARTSDVAPVWLYHDPEAGAAAVRRALGGLDPLYGGDLRLETVTRLQGHITPKWLQATIPGLATKALAPGQMGPPTMDQGIYDRVVPYMRAMNVLPGERITLSEAVAAAMYLAQHKIDPGTFANNIRYVAQWGQSFPQLDPLRAVELAGSQDRFRSVYDVAQHVVANIAPELVKRAAIGRQQRGVARGPTTAFTGTVQEAGILPDLTRHVATKPGDFLQQAQQIEKQVQLSETAWQRSWLNREIVSPTMHTWDRAWGAVEGSLMMGAQYALDPLAAGIQLAEGHGFSGAWDTIKRRQREAMHFAADAIAGKQSLGSFAAQHGFAPWEANMIDLGVRWELDPAILLGHGITMFRELRLAPALQGVRGLGGASEAQLARNTVRYTRLVNTFADRIVPKLHDAVYARDEGAMQLFNRNFVKNIESRPGGFDPDMLETMRRGIRTKWPTPNVDSLSATHDSVVSMLTGNPLPNPVVEGLWRARGALGDQAVAALQARDISQGVDTATRAVAQDVIDQAVEDFRPGLDAMTLRRARLEVPREARPIPGLGFRHYFKNQGQEVASETPLGRAWQKLGNQTPGNAMEFDRNPQGYVERWMRRDGGFSQREVAAQQASISGLERGVREEQMQVRAEKMMQEAARRYGAKRGLPEDVVKTIVDGVTTGVRNFNDQTVFGAVNESDFFRAPQPVTRPLMQTQLRNSYYLPDPLEIHRAIDSYVGTARRLRAAFYRALGKAPPGIGKEALLADQAAVTKRILRGLAFEPTTLWKQLVVGRPAYITRVVMLDEGVRFLATTGSFTERLLSNRWFGLVPKLAERGVFDRELELPTVGGGTAKIKLPLPGSLEREPMARSLPNMREWAQQSIDDSSLRETALKSRGPWSVIEPGKPGHIDYWRYHLTKTIPLSPSGREALQSVADGNSVDVTAARLRRFAGTPAGRDELQALNIPASEVRMWSEVEASLVHSYTLDDATLANAALRREVPEELLGRAPAMPRPAVHGPLIGSLHGDDPNRWRSLLDAWFRWTVREPHDVLNRIPYYKLWYSRARESYLRLLAERGGTMSPEGDQAIHLGARDFALAQLKRNFTDIAQNSRLGEMLGFINPFFNPFQQAIMNWGHILLRRNPALIGYAKVLADEGVKSGFLRKDPSTGEWVVPMSWWMGAAPLLGLAFHAPGWSLASPLKSFSLMFSDVMGIPTGSLAGNVPIPLPGLSPWAGFALQKIVGSHFRDNPLLTQYAFGHGAGVDVAPRWLSNAAKFISGDKGSPSDAIAFLRMQQFMGMKPDAAKAESQAHALSGFRALIGLFFPASPVVRFPQANREDEYQALITKYNGDVTKAADQFLKKYPEDSLITIGKTYWTKTLQGQAGPRIPATQAAEKIMALPGWKNFAAKFPAWGAAIILQSQHDQFDLATYGKQLTEGDLRYRTLKETILDDQARHAWNAINVIYNVVDNAHEVHTKHVQERLVKAGIPLKEAAAIADHFQTGTMGEAQLSAHGLSQDNLQWRDMERTKSDALLEVARLYPQWGAKYLTVRQEGGASEAFITENPQNQKVLSEALLQARMILKVPSVADFPAIQGLREYMTGRDAIEKRMEALGVSGIDQPTAVEAGLRAQYDDLLAKVNRDYPEFQPFYQSWFFNDLQSLISPAKRQLDILAQRNPQLHAELIRFDTRFQSLRQEVGASQTKAQKDVAYLHERDFLNQQIEQHGLPFVRRWWNTLYTGPQQGVYKQALLTRPPDFYSRWDWHLMGLDMNNQAANWMAGVQKFTTDIAQYKQKNPGASTAQYYQQIDDWVRGHLGKNATFDKAVTAINTWGYGAIAGGLVGTQTKGQRAWGAIVGAANKLRTQFVEPSGIHGDDSSVEHDPKNRALYATWRDQLLAYTNELRAYSPEFKTQWDDMNRTIGGGLIYWLMPTIYFKLGAPPSSGSTSSSGLPTSLGTIK